MTTPKNYPRAALLALTSFTVWTIADALLKLVREAHVPQGQMMLVCGLSGMAVIFFLSAARGTMRRLQPHKWSGLIALGVCQWVGFMCWVTALSHLPLTNMYVVSFLTPMTVACLAALVLKEPLGWKRAIPIAVGFAGVVIAVNPATLLQNSDAWLPYLTVFGSMAGTASQMLLLRAVGHRETGECVAFYPRFMIVISGIFYCATTGMVEMKSWVFMALFAAGALGSLGWVLMSQAYKNAPAAAVAPIQYVQMIIGALFGYLIWGDVPSAYLWCGAAVIIASGVYLVRHERRLSRMMIRVE